MQKNSKIYIAGHKGLVGSAILRKLQSEGYTNLVFKTKNELDLLDQTSVAEFFKRELPEFVFLAAAKVGGILANNNFPADFIYQNLVIQNNVIFNAYKFKVKKLLFLGSSCIYPRECPQPIKEEYLLTGPLEPTNEPYAIAKITGLKMCQSFNRQYGTNFISVMPTNLYGPNDNYDLGNSHVIPALIKKFHEAKIKKSPSVSLWGTGRPKREFLHVDDMADGCIFMMKNFNPTRADSEAGRIFLNLGTGEDLTIKELAQTIKKITGFTGKIIWDCTKPDGAPRKLLDVSKLHKLGWKHKIELKNDLKKTYRLYEELINHKSLNSFKR